ncbi:hypothetical protein EYF80_009544 [Liparis tanakae]|uniref:Uncharacterized protein n=1 Tax=Liparis tanakae TaxID=230148 RepID=A0A4Z2IQH9_9TELE|nr:hypothetical protein EYF80_009544 [Liparis tanakae]
MKTKTVLHGITHRTRLPSEASSSSVCVCKLLKRTIPNRLDFTVSQLLLRNGAEWPVPEEILTSERSQAGQGFPSPACRPIRRLPLPLIEELDFTQAEREHSARASTERSLSRNSKLQALRSLLRLNPRIRSLGFLRAEQPLYSRGLGREWFWSGGQAIRGQITDRL